MRSPVPSEPTYVSSETHGVPVTSGTTHDPAHADAGAATSTAHRATEHATRTTPSRPSWPTRALLALVQLYRWTALVRSPRCRFLPTCSGYAVDALRTHGALKGTVLAVRRVGRCHPWNPGGLDPVPPRE